MHTHHDGRRYEDLGARIVIRETGRAVLDHAREHDLYHRGAVGVPKQHSESLGSYSILGSILGFVALVEALGDLMHPHEKTLLLGVSFLTKK